MIQIGNKMSRSLWEAGKLKNRPLYSTPREEREKFIKAKYIDKEYLAELPYSGKPIYEVSRFGINLIGIVGHPAFKYTEPLDHVALSTVRQKFMFYLVTI